MNQQQQPYLEVTYRHGKPLAAYLYLRRRPDDKAAKTVRHNGWLVDYSADGRVIGVEFTQVSAAVNVGELNELLADGGQAGVAEDDLVPLRVG